MAASILESLAEGSLAMLGSAAHEWARHSFTTQKMAEEYLLLYRRTVGLKPDANVIPIFLFQPLNDIAKQLDGS